MAGNETSIPKIGVLAPTYNRPDLARFMALQMANQTLRPHVLCMHQNGPGESYAWTVRDIRTDIDIRWLHTPRRIAQEEWYAVPLERLIAEDCTHFFWCDHDDIYDATHMARGMAALNAGPFDFCINGRAGLLLLTPLYHFDPAIRFTHHDPGGMSSSMCFNRAFAVNLLKDLRANHGALAYADQVLNRVTKPKFRCAVTDAAPSTTYVCHPDTVSSSHWLLQSSIFAL